jgi:hypothetical protein
VRERKRNRAMTRSHTARSLHTKTCIDAMGASSVAVQGGEALVGVRTRIHANADGIELAGFARDFLAYPLVSDSKK